MQDVLLRRTIRRLRSRSFVHSPSTLALVLFRFLPARMASPRMTKRPRRLKDLRRFLQNQILLESRVLNLLTKICLRAVRRRRLHGSMLPVPPALSPLLALPSLRHLAIHRLILLLDSMSHAAWHRLLLLCHGHPPAPEPRSRKVPMTTIAARTQGRPFQNRVSYRPAAPCRCRTRQCRPIPAHTLGPHP